MNQITIRGFDDDLSVHLHSLAQWEGISLNQAALRLLRKGAGLAEMPVRPGIVDTSLDHLIGAWTQEEAEELDAALEEFETIDEAAWE